jgi:DNA-binding response OmpR family regulator
MSTNCTILIVDDEKDLLDMYREFFEMENFNVFSASSAELALKILQDHPEIQVIISDSHMKQMSGLDLLQELSKHPKMPLFYLATGDSADSELKILKLGATGLILKPFDMSEVIERILNDLNGRI